MRGDWDQDAFNASMQLVERTGANQVEIGYVRDGVPAEEAGWYASAQYHGARVTADEHRSPVEAIEALARRLLTGATCVFCGEKVSLGDFPGRRCRYTRIADQWVRGCTKTHSERDPKLVESGRRIARGPQVQAQPPAWFDAGVYRGCTVALDGDVTVIRTPTGVWWRSDCQACLRQTGEHFPRHEASAGCLSGRRAHCTCESCW